MYTCWSISSYLCWRLACAFLARIFHFWNSLKINESGESNKKNQLYTFPWDLGSNDRYMTSLCINYISKGIRNCSRIFSSRNTWYTTCQILMSLERILVFGWKLNFWWVLLILELHVESIRLNINKHDFQWEPIWQKTAVQRSCCHFETYIPANDK